MSAVLRPDRPSIPLPEQFLPAAPREVREVVGGHVNALETALPTFGGRLRDPHSDRHDREDRELIRLGILDQLSYYRARQNKGNPLRVAVINGDRLYRLIYSHNIRTNGGATWMGTALFGGGSGTGNGHALHASGTTGSSPTSTGFTSSITPGDTTSYVGHIVVIGSTYAYITAHGAGANAAFTIDRWYDTTVTTGAAVAAPASGAFVIVPGQGPAFWMALSNDATQTLDLTQTALTGEINANGITRTRAAIAFTAPTGGSGTLTSAMASYTEQVTFVASAAQSFQKSAIFTAYSGAASGGIMPWIAALTSTPLQTNDQAQVTWTIQY